MFKLKNKKNEMNIIEQIKNLAPTDEKIPAFNDMEHAEYMRFSKDVNIEGFDDPRVLPIRTLSIFGEDNINSITLYPINDRYTEWLKEKNKENSAEAISEYMVEMPSDVADEIWENEKFNDLYDIFELPFSILFENILTDNKLNIILSDDACSQIEEIIAKVLKIDKSDIFVPKYIMNINEVENNIFSLENLIELHKNSGQSVRYMGLEEQIVPKGVNLILLTITVAVYKKIPRFMDKEYIHKLLHEDETMEIISDENLNKLEQIIFNEVKGTEEVAMLTNTLADIIELNEIVSSYFIELEKALKKNNIELNKISM